ncbi:MULTISPECIES: HD domain-containing protein [unclassified Nocardioides]|uniref:HD domain-containing protein n=1 Tax=unclassified Nocardioides TaxID=2615069 RepID=UPI00301555E7
MDLSDRWPLPDSPDLRDELIAAYADETRGYHDTLHLTEVLDRLDELAAAGTSYDVRAVLLAAWFHDAVYDGERDAEERSATWAEDALPGLVAPEVVEEVARLVRLTETHHPEDHDANGCALSDADLAILAAPAERYASYTSSVRQEYAHLDDEVFRAGRAQVLGGLADKEHLFHTAYAREQWEAAARANLERELDGLQA